MKKAKQLTALCVVFLTCSLVSYPDRTDARPGQDASPGNQPPFYSEQPRDQLPLPVDGLSVHGVYPGLFRCEIEQKLGKPLLAKGVFDIYPDGKGGTINAYFHLRNLCYRVEGDALDSHGRWFIEDPPVSKRVVVFNDHTGKPVCYRLNATDKAGSGFLLPTPGSSFRILDFAKALRKPEPPSPLELLKLYPEIIDARRVPDGDTAIHLAVRHDELQVARYLLELGADVNSKDFHGVTPINLARSEEMTQLLIDSGASLEE